MSARVAYLLGAGASALRIPIVRNISGRIKEVTEIIQIMKARLDALGAGDLDLKGWELYQVFKECDLLRDDLIWMADYAGRSASVDTFARRLYFQEEEAYLRLKRTLSSYFVIEQLNQTNSFTYDALTTLYDLRYEALIASLLKGRSLKLPGEITVLTWNYDYQFEKAYADFLDPFNKSGSTSLYKIQKQIGVRVNGLPWEAEEQDFSLIKLNGTAALGAQGNLQPMSDDIRQNLDFQALVELTRVFHEVRLNLQRGHVKPLLRFAWENSNQFEGEFWRRLATTLRGVEVLVVIGYSFPFFNRNVDREVVKLMTNLQKQKVYFQDIRPDDIVKRWRSIYQGTNDVKPEPYGETDQFFLPPEL
jgi:hypothetical protein